MCVERDRGAGCVAGGCDVAAGLWSKEPCVERGCGAAAGPWSSGRARAVEQGCVEPGCGTGLWSRAVRSRDVEQSCGAGLFSRAVERCGVRGAGLRSKDCGAKLWKAVEQAYSTAL